MSTRRNLVRMARNAERLSLIGFVSLLAALTFVTVEYSRAARKNFELRRDRTELIDDLMSAEKTLEDSNAVVDRLRDEIERMRQGLPGRPTTDDLPPIPDDSQPTGTAPATLPTIPSDQVRDNADQPGQPDAPDAPAGTVPTTRNSN